MKLDQAIVNVDTNSLSNHKLHTLLFLSKWCYIIPSGKENSYENISKANSTSNCNAHSSIFSSISKCGYTLGYG